MKVDLNLVSKEAEDLIITLMTMMMMMMMIMRIKKICDIINKSRIKVKVVMIM